MLFFGIMCIIGLNECDFDALLFCFMPPTIFVLKCKFKHCLALCVFWFSHYVVFMLYFSSRLRF